MAATVAEYIAGFEGLTRERLEDLRELVLEILPDAVEGVSYGIAGYKVNGKPVVYLGGFTSHMGLYPVTALPEDLEKQVAPYRSGKGTARFANTEPLPRDLIADLVRFLANRAAS